MENLINVKPPSSLLNKIKYEAPSITISENYGRSGGYYGDEDSESSGYRAVLIYIQKGLSEYKDLILKVVKLVLNVQSGAGIKYPLVPFGFGNSDKLIHEGKYFDLGYTNDLYNDFKITETLQRISGTEPSVNPSIITELYPKAGMKSLYGGKTRIDNNDLLVIIGKKDEVAFASELEPKITSKIRKHILFVEIDNNTINWNFKLQNLNILLIKPNEK
jgi:hypothetical protein